MTRFWPLVTALLVGCGSCDDTASSNNGDGTPDMTLRTEEDIGAGPCQGCFDEAGDCQSGEEQQACGSGGTSCVACEAGSVCTDDGECVQPPDCQPDNCDGCCDANDECVTGDAVSACGSDGRRCSECPTDAACVAGQCELGCGPDSCNGCCDTDGQCQSGTDQETCGTGGAPCSDCTAEGTVCGGGACVTMGCAQTCAGCCDGDTCVDPVTSEQCGAAGGSCRACDEPQTCVAGMCEAPDGSRWNLILLSADVPNSKLSGAGWDTFGGLPDVIAFAYTLDPITDESWLETSEVFYNTLTPVFMDFALEGVSTAALEERLTFEFWDRDDIFDDEICVMDIVVEPSMMNGQIIETACDDDPSMTWRWKIEAAP